MANAHTPDDLAAYSTLVHNLAGWLVLVMAAAMLAEALSHLGSGRWRYLWPGLGAFVGLGIWAYVFFHLWLYHRVSPFADPNQVQHQLLGLTLGVGACLELVRRRLKVAARAWQGAWPVPVVAVGVQFVHWALASTLVLAGFALLAAVLMPDGSAPLRVFAILVLSAAAAQLIAFREQPASHGDHRGETRPPSDHGTLTGITRNMGPGL